MGGAGQGAEFSTEPGSFSLWVVDVGGWFLPVQLTAGRGEWHCCGGPEVGQHLPDAVNPVVQHSALFLGLSYATYCLRGAVCVCVCA